MSKHILNIDDVEYRAWEHGDRFEAQLGAISTRIGAETFPVTIGDVIACPPDGPETAHQLINTSETGEMKYLAVGTSMSPEIAEYPDSEKIGVLAEFPADGDGKPTVMRYIIRGQAGMAEYWEGE